MTSRPIILDMQARAVLSRYLNRKRGFILVSHDRAFLDGCVDHILSINRAGIEIQQGNFSSWAENRARQDQFERSRNEKLKQDIRRLETAASQTARWSDRVEKSKTGAADKGHVGHMAAKMMKRSKAVEARREKAAAEKAGLLKNIEMSGELKLSPLAHRERVLVEAKGLSVAYGEKPVLEGLDFNLLRGERLALLGRNGTGKSSILKLVLGESVPHTGTLRRAGGLVLSSVPQRTDFCGAACPALPRRRESTKASSRPSCCKSWLCAGTSLKNPWRTSAAGRRKRCFLQRAFASARTCMSGTSRSTLSTCYPVSRSNACCANSRPP